MEHRGSISENQLFWGGINAWSERKSLAIWLKLASKARVIVDAGANSGFYSLSAAAVNSDATVIAFEPIIETHKWLLKNISLNENLNIVAECLAVSNACGKATIWLDSHRSHYTPSLYQAKNRPLDEGLRVSIQTVTLDEYFKLKKLSSLDLIKIDVERYEPEVLFGMRGLLKRFRPSILIEVLDDYIGSRVENQIDGLGYLYYNINEESGVVRRVYQISKSDSLNYLIVQPSTAVTLGLDDVH